MIHRSLQEEEAIITVRNWNVKKGVDAGASTPIVRRPPDARVAGSFKSGIDFSLWKHIIPGPAKAGSFFTICGFYLSCGRVGLILAFLRRS